MAEELKNYQITEEEYEKILKARKRLAKKQKEKAQVQEFVQGFSFDFDGWDRETSTPLIQARKIQAIPEMNMASKENIWRQMFANNECGEIFVSFDSWKNARDEKRKLRCQACGVFIPEAELTDETLEFILKEFKNYKSMAISHYNQNDQDEIDFFQRRIKKLKKLIKVRQKQLNVELNDTFICYSICTGPIDRSVGADSLTRFKMKYKKFLKVIKGGK